GTGHSFLWIGTNDMREEGVFRWLGGGEADFFSWHPSEPNDDTHSQNCVSFNPDDSEDKTCDGYLTGYVCEYWSQDVVSGRFHKITTGELSSSNMGIAPAFGFSFTTDSKMTCAAECRKQRHLCDGFVFSASAKTCYSLRQYDDGDSAVLTATQIQSITDTSGSVYFMHG
ncbi:hypothetical protein BaRGS_00023623, partial [Batillaria attramentaria]